MRARVTRNRRTGFCSHAPSTPNVFRGDALSKAITHVGTHIADLREHGVTNACDFEAHAWETVIFSISQLGKKR